MSDLEALRAEYPMAFACVLEVSHNPPHPCGKCACCRGWRPFLQVMLDYAAPFQALREAEREAIDEADDPEEAQARLRLEREAAEEGAILDRFGADAFGDEATATFDVIKRGRAMIEADEGSPDAA